MNYKKKFSHRLMALTMAAVMCCTYLPIGAFAETPPPQETTVAAEERQTNETETDNGQTDASSPDPGAATAEIAAPTTDEPAEEKESYTFDGEVLYQDMPDAPTGSYIGSYGLPVATGETKIGLGAWDADLEQDSYLSAEALDSDNLTLAAPLLEDADYAIVPILAQVEYPADGSSLDLVLPDGVLGVSTWVEGNCPLIVLDTREEKTTVERLRFTAAHELAHLLFKVPEGLDAERMCNLFASYFLLPKNTLIQELGTKRDSIYLEELIDLRQYYGVSVAAIVHEAYDFGIISREHYDYWYDTLIKHNVKETGWGTYVFPETLGKERRMEVRIEKGG